MKTFVTVVLLVLVVVDGQKKSNEYVSIFKRKHLFPVFVLFFFELLIKGLWENLVVFLGYLLF